VAKLRNQLTLSNQQLTECDQHSGKLRDELENAKIMVGNRVTEIEQLRQQEENNMDQWNQLLGEKDSQILDLQDKLDSLLQPRMNSARSREELEAIADSEGGLVAVTKQLKNISALLMDCSQCQKEPCKELKETVYELETLSSIICGGAQNPSLKKLSSLRRLDLLRCESEELLSKSTMALNFINNCHNSIEEVDGEDDHASEHSSYHSSASQTHIDQDDDLDDHQTILARSLEKLQHKLNRMEQELIIVGEESKELQLRLGQREDDLTRKNQDLKDLAAVVEHMRQLNVRTVEQLEKQKIKTNSALGRLEQTQGLLSEQLDKCSNKDLLMRTLVDIMQNLTEFSVATLVRSLRETTVKPSFVKKGGQIDFNLENLCQYLEFAANDLIRQRQQQEAEQDTEKEQTEVEHYSAKKITPTLMPPQNFRITRRVGSDSLLVAWTPPDDNEVTGYIIYVNGHLHQKVRSASRTKALLHGLNLKKVDFELSIHSIGCHGTTVSTSDVVNYVKEMVLKPPPVPMSTKK